LRLTFATGELPAEARFETFRDGYVRPLFQMDIASRTARPYAALLDLHVTAPAIFGRIRGDDADVVRAPRLAAQCPEGVWLLMNRAGGLRVRQDEVQRELRPGEGIIFNAVRPHGFRCHGHSDTSCVKLDEAQLRLLRAGGAPHHTTLLTAGSPLAGLMAGVLEAFYRVDAGTRDAAELTGQYLADMVALALRAGPDGARIAEGRGLRAGRLQAVLDEIARRAGEPAFGAADVARRLDVTPRYVHRLLEETGATFSEHVLRRRLDRAHGRLRHLHGSGARIADIAYEAGFSDLSHFNRSFRRHFGLTPSELRAQARRDA
jgi:AraC-like DNA-binding protein